MDSRMFRQAMSCEILVQTFNDEASPNLVVDVLDHILKIIVGKLTSWVAVEFLIARFSSLGGVHITTMILELGHIVNVLTTALLCFGVTSVIGLL